MSIRGFAPCICLALALAAASGAAAGGAKTGIATYPSWHYLGGQSIQPGYDVFGWNFEAHSFYGSSANWWTCWYGLPPYQGDTDSYLAALDGFATAPPDPAYLTWRAWVQDQWWWSWRDFAEQDKWNDTYISNRDHDGDGGLEGHLVDFPTVIADYGCFKGTDAWTTFQQDWWFDSGGVRYQVAQSSKLVAAPSGAVLGEGPVPWWGGSPGPYWYAADGAPIGVAAMDETYPFFFARMECLVTVEGEVVAGCGVSYVSPTGAGLGRAR